MASWNSTSVPANRASRFAALRDTLSCPHWYAGTRDELVAAGVIDADTVSGRDDYGHRVIIRALANGRLRVIKCTPIDLRSAKTIEHAVGDVVADMLRKFAR